MAVGCRGTAAPLFLPDNCVSLQCRISETPGDLRRNRSASPDMALRNSRRSLSAWHDAEILRVSLPRRCRLGLPAARYQVQRPSACLSSLSDQLHAGIELLSSHAPE